MKLRLALLFVFAAATGLAAERNIVATSLDGARYSARLTPESPSVGELAIVEFQLDGVAASTASVASLLVSPTLSVETESLRPAARAGSVPGALLRLEFRVLGAGKLQIEAMELDAGGRRIKFGRITLAELAKGGGSREPSWRWIAPKQAYRYEAFEVRLERPGAGAARDGAKGSGFRVPIPKGASIEASGPDAWTVMALEAGPLLLPELSSGAASSGQADALEVAILPLPSGLESTRAIGSFTAALSKLEPQSPIAGSPFSLSLVISGRGNLPALLVPEPTIALDGAPLKRDAWSSSRVDDFKPDGGGYSGLIKLELQISPPREGTLSLSFPPMATLDPSGGAGRLGSLGLPSLRLKVAKATKAGSTKPSSAQGAIAWPSSLREASDAWNRGERGRAAAQLYGLLRRSSGPSAQAAEARKAALACAAQLGTDAPMLDRLGPPFIYWISALAVAFAAALLFIVSRRRGRGRTWLRGEALLLALALILAFGGLASAAERRQKYAVIWTDSLYVVPSAKSELRVRVAKGSTARLRGMAGRFAGLTLADGIEGWAMLDSIYWY